MIFSIFRTEDVLFQLKIRGGFEKLKNQTRPLLRPRSIYIHQHFLNLSHKTVPLNVFFHRLHVNRHDDDGQGQQEAGLVGHATSVRVSAPEEQAGVELASGSESVFNAFSTAGQRCQMAVVTVTFQKCGSFKSSFMSVE